MADGRIILRSNLAEEKQADNHTVKRCDAKPEKQPGEIKTQRDAQSEKPGEGRANVARLSASDIRNTDLVIQVYVRTDDLTDKQENNQTTSVAAAARTDLTIKQDGGTVIVGKSITQSNNAVGTAAAVPDVCEKSSSPHPDSKSLFFVPVSEPEPDSLNTSSDAQQLLQQSEGGRQLDDVFANGSEESDLGAGGSIGWFKDGSSSQFLHPDGTSGAGSEPAVMPRKSSLIKDSSRRGVNRHKKTVSFSSMPGERTVINGESLNTFVNREANS